MRTVFAAALLYILMTFSAAAQDNYWVQIEARQTLTGAQERARAYASRLDGVHGYYLGDGFYGIFIGPYTERGAQTALAQLLGRGAVPSDSFVKNGRFFKQQFWPIGGTAAAAPPQPSAAAQPIAPPKPGDETAQEARASERALTREQRQELQTALKWAGFYTAAIDGSFGRGTRGAMELWQIAKNYEATGILTTGQRAELLDDYNSVLDGMNLRLVRDEASGIQMQIPTDVVAFTEYQPPFVRFEASGEIDAQVLFISQSGDAGRMRGLYEIMQILDIVPPDGPRQITANGFVIEGISDEIHSYTEVGLQDNEIKGFTLVWPAGDEQRRIRVLEVMQPTFERLAGTLDPNIVPPTEDQAIDMVAGLSVRQPQSARSGFFVSPDGAVITTSEAVKGCERVTIDRDYDAQSVFVDEELGVALLRADEPLAPSGIAAFDVAVPRLQDQVSVGGYPYNGILGAPTLTFGQIEDIRGLTGDNRIKRLSILPQQSDAGGPVFNDVGAVVGMLLPRMDDETRVLPPEVNFSLDAQQIVDLLAAQGITAEQSDATDPISPVALTRKATEIAVLVSCW